MGSALLTMAIRVVIFLVDAALVDGFVNILTVGIKWHCKSRRPSNDPTDPVIVHRKTRKITSEAITFNQLKCSSAALVVVEFACDQGGRQSCRDQLSHWKRKITQEMAVGDTCPAAVASAGVGDAETFSNLSAPRRAAPLPRSSADISTINKPYLPRTNTSYWSKRSHFNLVVSDGAHCVVVHPIQLALSLLFRRSRSLLSFFSFEEEEEDQVSAPPISLPPCLPPCHRMKWCFIR